MTKHLLSFSVPTWNRDDILDEALEDLITKIKKYEFPILVYDNGSTDKTELIVSYWKKQYSNIIYYKQPSNCGADRNFEAVLKASVDVSYYTWLIGDCYRIERGELANIIALVQKNYAVVVVNTCNRVKKIPSKEYDSHTLLLKELGWHMTMISSLIFSNRIILNDVFYKYYDTDFIQDGIIFEYLAENTTEKVYFHNANSIMATSRFKESWSYKQFDVFGVNWVKFVLSLPNIPKKSKLFCIKRHNVTTRLFFTRNLFNLKENGWLEYNKILPTKEYVKLATTTPWGIIAFISKTPYRIAIIFKYPLKIYEKISRIWNGYYRYKA